MEYGHVCDPGCFHLWPYGRTDSGIFKQEDRGEGNEACGHGASDTSASILGFSALAVSMQAGLDGITNPGFHGLSQVLYEYSSSAANNGSGFEGLADNSLFWNMTTGLAMFFGRYLAIIAQLAIAGSLLGKRRINESAGTLRTDTVTFMVVLIFIVYIFAALTFFPALALGPIAEHLSLWL